MKKYDVVGIGNAVVDIISPCDDVFLEKMGIEKGIMQLIEKDRAELLYNSMDVRTKAAGGSVANTIAGIGSLGRKTAFIGRVSDDELGRYYADATSAAGTDFLNKPVPDGKLPTSRSMIFNSQDGNRSMNTYLGISGDLSTDDMPTDLANLAAIVFMEGYLFDKDKGKQAFEKLAKETKLAGGKTGIAISDPFCVERHRGDFLSLIENDLDFVIGNEDEIKALFEMEDLEKALKQIAKICPLVVCTKAHEGVTAIQDSKRVDVGVNRISPVDTTGAGDQFAAGFLYGLASGYDLETNCKMGNIAAGEVIGHIGPRPKVSVNKLFVQSSLISDLTD